MGFLDKFLTRDAAMANGMMWIGPAGTFTSLHHDLTNNFIAQVVGRKQIKLLPAGEVGRLYNREHVFSDISDLDSPNIDAARHPRLAGARAYDLTIEPGEILFVPLAWWHQVKALDFSVTVTYTNFRWPNDGYATYPGG
jgi:ribosomal protein L16 Arg81 hydroxylase